MSGQYNTQTNTWLKLCLYYFVLNKLKGWVNYSSLFIQHGLHAVYENKALFLFL